MLEVWSVVAVLVAAGVVKAFQDLYWRPRLMLNIFRKQGITGPVPSVFVGNLPKIREIAKEDNSSGGVTDDHSSVISKVLPFYPKWSSSYGETFLLWWGLQPRLVISDPELMKEVLCDKSRSFDRDPSKYAAKDLFGEGMAVLRMTDKWSQKRKMVSMAFHTDKLKDMIGTMAACVDENLKGWDASNSEVDVAVKLKDLTADVICRTAFGTSYEAGRKVFQLQLEQQHIHLNWESSVHIPGVRFLPTANNRRRWMLKNEIDKLLHDMVVRRMHQVKSGSQSSFGNDLLGLMMAAKEGVLENSHVEMPMTMQDVIDECKTFFFTGHETSATLLAWTMLLLALNPDWQERLREEVHQVCGSQPPTHLEMLNNLKCMVMVLNESLRLYSPVPCLNRYVHKDTKLRHLQIPKGTLILLPFIVANLNIKLWGEDAARFNPNRFSQQETRAFLPFSIGPRYCVGQNFALIEAKVTLSIILQRYKFELSKDYVHSPFNAMTLQPRYGMPMKLIPATSS